MYYLWSGEYTWNKLNVLYKISATQDSKNIFLLIRISFNHWKMFGSLWFFFTIQYTKNRHCYFLPFHSIFSPIFPIKEEWKEVANLKLLFPSTFLLIWKIAITFYFDCYFLPFYEITISFHFLFLTKMMNDQQWAGQITIWGFLAKSWRLY
jgi:hypothetical protein